MNRLSNNLLVVLVAVGAAGCGFGGGSGGGGTSTAPITSNTGPVTSASYLPTQVLRAPAYSFDVVYTPNQAAGGAITALGAAPTTTDVWCGISPLGRVDHVDQNGPVAEASFVFDVQGFAVVGSNVFAGTANTVANRAGAVYSRDAGTGQWALSLDGTLKECVPASYLNEIFAFSGENDGRAATVSHLDSATSTWTDVASLGSMVPACALEFNGEVWVGGRTNNSLGGPAKLFHGTGVAMSEMTVPTATFMGQIASVQAMCQANGGLFVGVEIRDANTGATVGGQLFVFDGNKLVSLESLQADAPITLASADGTVYAGTRAGKLLWLDESGKWNEESGLSSNLGVTALVWNGRELELGIRSQQGAELLVRRPLGAVPSGFQFTSITPASGPLAGGTAVTIMGNNFADVTVVKVGGVALTGLKVVSDVQITGTTGAGVAGAVDVVITSPTKGTATGKGAFTYKSAVTGLSYATDIKPIIDGKCVICHSPTGIEKAWPMDTYAAIQANYDATAKMKFVEPGDLAKSMIAHKIDSAIGGSNATMAAYPSAAEKAKIEQWIKDGGNP